MMSEVTAMKAMIVAAAEEIDRGETTTQATIVAAAASELVSK